MDYLHWIGYVGLHTWIIPSPEAYTVWRIYTHAWSTDISVIFSGVGLYVDSSRAC